MTFEYVQGTYIKIFRLEVDRLDVTHAQIHGCQPPISHQLLLIGQFPSQVAEA